MKGQVVNRTSGQRDKWSTGQVVNGTSGPMVKGQVGDGKSGPIVKGHVVIKNQQKRAVCML